ncbi:MAG: hypothetical protein P8179_10975 [Candidatus Thiodiazotropha sp.]
MKCLLVVVQDKDRFCTSLRLHHLCLSARRNTAMRHRKRVIHAVALFTQ